MSFDPNINTKASGFCVSGFSDSDSTHPDRHFPGSSCKYVSANFYGKSHGILVAGLLSDYCWFQLSTECGFRRTRS